MTSLGIAAGVGLFVGVTAITSDLRQQLSASFQTYGLEVVVYERRANSPTSSRISPAQMVDLQAAYGDALMPLVMSTKTESFNSYAMILGVTHEFLLRIPLVSGAPYAEGSGDILVGEIAAQQLGVRAGQTLPLDGRDRRVSGLFRTGSRVLDGGFMMDISDAQRALAREGAEPTYSMGLLRAGSAQEADRLIAEVNQRYAGLHAIRGTEFAGALRLMRVVDAFVKTIAVIALLGTCLVVVVTLLMAISERTREIGILMAVGWTPWLVLRTLFAEIVLLCVVGTGLGNLLALGMLRWVNGMESVGFGWIPLHYPFSVAAASFVMVLSVSVIALAWPALILYRVQPLTALRHE
jgi:putative ABC transport system permease protein